MSKLFGEKTLLPAFSVLYDGVAFSRSDCGGKEAQLRTLLDAPDSAFLGLSPRGLGKFTADAPTPIIQQGLDKYLVWQQTSLPALLAKFKPNVFLAPYNTAPLWVPSCTKLITVVHDLILIEGARESSIKQRLIDIYRAGLCHSAIKRSALVLTVSNFTANRIMQRYPQVTPYVINCTVRPSWYVRSNMVSTQLRKPYILIVTTTSRVHKNAIRAIAAFARYRSIDSSSKIQIRMVGVSRERTTVAALAKRFGLPVDSVIIEPFLCEADLQTLYRNATCVIVPSLMEGFGIPVLEAMASGTPVVCSSTGSLPEVGGDAPLYFDPTNVDDMAHTLFLVCTNASLRMRLSNRGVVRAETFHPDRVRSQVREFWHNLPELYKSWVTR